MHIDLSKHLYDLTVLFKTERTQKFLNNVEEFKKIVQYKRKEEIFRKGGVDKDIEIKDFGYFNMKYNSEMSKAFKLMQDKYIFKEEYKITIEDTMKILNEIREKIIKMEE